MPQVLQQSLSIEMFYLIAAIVLGLAHLFSASAAATAQRGMAWNASSRDEPAPPLKGLAGRVERASANFKETFPLFAAAILAAQVTSHLGTLTYWGVMLYFWARIVYIPLYLFGVIYVRSLVWMISVAGICCILASFFVA